MGFVDKLVVGDVGLVKRFQICFPIADAFDVKLAFNVLPSND
ncbi:MAG: hypothetical protein AAFO03_18120 [Bacteroidota bacterium]